MDSCKVAIVQTGPIYLDKRASFAKAQEILESAVQEQANLVVFGESWFSGYPVWLDCCTEVALWDHTPTKKVFGQMMKSGISIPGPETELFAEKAREGHMAIVLGCNEVVRGTIYNTALIFDEEGNLACHHRKLMPTYTEKMVYGVGDGKGLCAVSTSFGNVTASICWEHFMPLTRQALHDQGETIHVALWPRVHEMLQVASRQYAFEGRCFVVSAGQMTHRSDMPKDLGELRSERDWLLDGGSAIYGPDGMPVLQPQFEVNEVIYHTITDLDKTDRERMTLDTTGHYARRDVFKFEVDRSRSSGS